MRRLMLVTLITSLLVGCGVSPSATLSTVKQPTAKVAKAATTKPAITVKTDVSGPAPTVSIVASLPSTPEVEALSQEAAANLIAADADLESVELLIQDGGAYFVQGWFSDAVDYVKRTWTRWKLSWAVKAELKQTRDKNFELHEGAIDTLRKNRTAPVTKINNLADGAKEIVSTWTSTNKGTFDVETRRTVDDEGVTQILGITMKGKDDKDLAIDISRIRTLMGEDGTYQVATKKSATYKDGRSEYQEWLKRVNANGTEKLTGFINHPDGNRTDITGTKDLKGKVKVEVSKISPAHNPSPQPQPSPSASPAA